MTRTLYLLFFCLVTTAHSQQPVVLLDPARGGSESGPRIADRISEKQVTLDLAARLASLLRARGFTVAMTREADLDVTNDARAAMANNLHPIACILLHAAPSGSGVHLYTTALHQKVAPAGTPVLWDEAQAAYTDRSHALAEEMKAALQQAKLVASTGQTWMRPLDNMQCAAVAVEIAPEKDGTGAEDSSYQAHISNALANTMLGWRDRVASMVPPEPKPTPKPVQAISLDKALKPATDSAADPNRITPTKPSSKPRTPSRLPSLKPLNTDSPQP